MREIEIDEITGTSSYTTLENVMKWIVKEFEEGYNAYFSAKMIADCPYMPASEKARLWCEGYANAKRYEFMDQDDAYCGRYD